MNKKADKKAAKIIDYLKDKHWLEQDWESRDYSSKRKVQKELRNIIMEEV